ncbi:hypothetical protein FTX61_01320 [Nitriliruptoraceae bacterium ZYF776]|nr:hypothetical protein [Profundirhabdus halotolerans]
MRDDTDEPCADCGAVGCEASFHACLAADFSDPAYGQVHHLVVPAYGLQHGWYTIEAATAMVTFVLDHLDRPPTDHDRRTIRADADGPVQARAREPRPRRLAWGGHVGDVDLTTADRYVTTVRRWAGAVATSLRNADAANEHASG